MNILNRFSLRVRIFLILGALMFITLWGGMITMWYTYQMEGLLSEIIDRRLAAFQGAEALEIALVNQKGLVSYYLQDADLEWLRQLGEYRQIFKERLNEAKSLANTEGEKEAVEAIESVYLRYIALKDKVIEHYQSGEMVTGARLHKEARKNFFQTLQLCENYKAFYQKGIQMAREKSYIQARQLRIIAISAMAVFFLLAVLMAFILLNQILRPIRRLALVTDRKIGPPQPENEVTALSRGVRGLIEDIHLTHSELEKSREHLLQAEKMALVGKLAAGVAHSIRNPLTSVKMRLFSLGRTLDLSPPQKEDFEVISEEIRHLDTIVQNFLEFSRPPKLKMQKVSPSEIVDIVLQLLQHRLESYNVEVTINRGYPLSEIQADPEQLKEVLVNLIVNACEAMENGGSITIQEEESVVEPLGRVGIIRLIDNGPGIPESLQKKIFEPFFTTKEEGTGLGLSIALRIVEEHGGLLDLRSQGNGGTAFVITLPIKDSDQ